MERQRKNTIEVLRNLIANCTLVEQLLNNASLEVEDTGLKDIFVYYARENANYICKLKSEILRLGGELDEMPQPNDMHKYLQPSFNEEDLQNLIFSCEERVKNVARNFKEASMRDDILWEIVPIVAKQYYGEQEAYERIRNISTLVVPS